MNFYDIINERVTKGESIESIMKDFDAAKTKVAEIQKSKYSKFSGLTISPNGLTWGVIADLILYKICGDGKVNLTKTQEEVVKREMIELLSKMKIATSSFNKMISDWLTWI